MNNEQLINRAWEERDRYTATSEGPVRSAVDETLAALDNGTLRVAEKLEGEWVVHQWLKKTVLLSFVLYPFKRVATQNDALTWWDKVPSKFSRWDSEEFSSRGFRAVPGAFVRHSAYIAPNVVLMPCFVNVGAHIGSGTMVDTWATVGSCAQIGKNCHISGGTGIGGVLEPLQAKPVIVEDNCFIGARSEVVEGVIVEEGSVLSMGVFIGASTKIYDTQSGQILRGRIPAYSVVVPGTLPMQNPNFDGSNPNLYCAVIIKKVDASTRAKTSINDLLRD
ncbi:MAG: 2,3,4,5-tetrahydropyridine-2,6-dicarboxylate N-succinyltransferase [Gammaproteobacteria bacterium]|nr:2,3,4,5-tetrahydropyridine-2,6-dicarboxylate N-succinyltransferase [Gammaproteobacteria bacterium]